MLLKSSQNGDFVGSLAKGIATIRAFDGPRDQLTLSEVAKVSGLDRAAARRSLLTLKTLGYIQQDGRYFQLSPRILELGFPYLTANGWIERAPPHMRKLSDRFEESTSIAVLDGVEIIYVARMPAIRAGTLALNIGTRLPALYTAMGRIQLGSLPDDELRRRVDGAGIGGFTHFSLTSRNSMTDQIASDWSRGYSIVDQELEIGFRSVAAPIRDRSNQVIAALNMSTDTSRITLPKLRREVVPHLLDAAEEISAISY